MSGSILSTLERLIYLFFTGLCPFRRWGSGGNIADPCWQAARQGFKGRQTVEPKHLARTLCYFSRLRSSRLSCEINIYTRLYRSSRASLVAQWWRICLPMQEMSVIPELGRFPGEGNDNPLQYSCWEIPWIEEPGGLQSMGYKRARHDLATKQQ